jgi:hypothetical protein
MLLSRPERPARSEQQEPTMFTSATRRVPRPSTAARLRQITAARAVIAGSALAWAAAVPAASATTIPVPGPGAAYGPAPDTLTTPVQVISVSGIHSWQVTLIAVAAALVAATAAVVLDRARASRRTASTTG